MKGCLSSFSLLHFLSFPFGAFAYWSDIFRVYGQFFAGDIITILFLFVSSCFLLSKNPPNNLRVVFSVQEIYLLFVSQPTGKYLITSTQKHSVSWKATSAKDKCRTGKCEFFTLYSSWKRKKEARSTLRFGRKWKNFQELVKHKFKRL